MSGNRHEPVRHTCPDIDKCIEWLKAAEDQISFAIEAIEIADNDLSAENEKAENALRDAKDYLEEALSLVDFSGTLEELRNANSALRDWGHSLVSECEELENKISSIS